MARGAMNIILVSNNMAKAKTLSLLHISIAIVTLVVLSVLIALMLIVPQEAATQKSGKSLIPNQLRFSFNNPQKHLDAYATQLGEMQARMMLLDAQSERLAKLAGEKKVTRNQISDTNKNTKPNLNLLPNIPALKGQAANRGGPLVRDAPLSEAELQTKIAEFIADIELRAEHLGDIEAKLLQQSVSKNTLPNSSPIDAAFNSSSFGWRLDPFNGHQAFHEGLDFTATSGASIYAAASGIVSFADQTPDYGKIVKIDHGSGLETRYAHASKLLVKAGERIQKGQKIAEVGTTGRSTGPHLHYEIRLDGNPLDPRKYLKASN